MRGIHQHDFFDNLAAAGVKVRLIDDPMVRSGYAWPLVTVGVAGLFLDEEKIPLDEATFNMIGVNLVPLRALIAGHGIAELQRSHQLSEADGRLLVRLLADPDLIDFIDWLFTPEDGA